jgi:hypothetical protein
LYNITKYKGNASQWDITSPQQQWLIAKRQRKYWWVCEESGPLYGVAKNVNHSAVIKNIVRGSSKKLKIESSYVKEISALPCFLQHYLKYSRNANKLSAHQLMDG